MTEKISYKFFTQQHDLIKYIKIYQANINFEFSIDYLKHVWPENQISYIYKKL